MREGGGGVGHIRQLARDEGVIGVTNDKVSALGGKAGGRDCWMGEKGEIDVGGEKVEEEGWREEGRETYPHGFVAVRIGEAARGDRDTPNV